LSLGRVKGGPRPPRPTVGRPAMSLLDAGKAITTLSLAGEHGGKSQVGSKLRAKPRVPSNAAVVQRGLEAQRAASVNTASLALDSPLHRDWSKSEANPMCKAEEVEALVRENIQLKKEVSKLQESLLASIQNPNKGPRLMGGGHFKGAAVDGKAKKGDQFAKEIEMLERVLSEKKVINERMTGQMTALQRALSMQEELVAAVNVELTETRSEKAREAEHRQKAEALLEALQKQIGEETKRRRELEESQEQLAMANAKLSAMAAALEKRMAEERAAAEEAAARAEAEVRRLEADGRKREEEWRQRVLQKGQSVCLIWGAGREQAFLHWAFYLWRADASRSRASSALQAARAAGEREMQAAALATAATRREQETAAAKNAAEAKAMEAEQGARAYKAQATKLEAEQAHLKVVVDEAKVKLEELAAKRAVMESDIAKLEQARAAMVADVEAARADKRAADTKLSARESDLSREKAARSRAEDASKKLEREVKELQGLLEAAKVAHLQKGGMAPDVEQKYQRRERTLLNEIETLKKDREEWKRRGEELQRSADAPPPNTTTLAKPIVPKPGDNQFTANELKSQVAALMKDKRALEKQVASSEGLRNEVEGLRKESKKLRDAQAYAKKELEGVRQQLQEQKDSIAAAEAAQKAAEERAAALEKQLSKGSGATAELEAKAAEARRSADKLRDELRDAKERVEELQDSRKRMLADAVNVESRVSESGKSADVFRSRAEAAEARVVELSTAMDASEERTKASEAQMRALAQAVEEDLDKFRQETRILVVSPKVSINMGQMDVNVMSPVQIDQIRDAVKDAVVKRYTEVHNMQSTACDKLNVRQKVEEMVEPLALALQEKMYQLMPGSDGTCSWSTV